MRKRLSFFFAAIAAMASLTASAQTKEVDYTTRLSTANTAWKDLKTDGTAGVCATQFAPAITTKDGRNAQLAEKYEVTVATTGDLLQQTVSGLPNGTYRVSIYGNAFYTPGRGFSSDVTEGQMDVAYLYAGTGNNRVQDFIPVSITTSTTENSLVTLEDVVVTDGTLVVGIGKAQAGSNWHTIQVYEITAIVDLSDLVTASKNAVQALVDEANALDYKTRELESAVSNANGLLDQTPTDADAAETLIDQLDACAESLPALIARAKNEQSVAEASVSSPVVTDFVINGVMEGSTEPWQSTTGAQNKALASNQQGAFNVPFYENWHPSNYTGKMYQVIENIPNGLYRLDICAFVTNFAGEGQTSQFVYANNDKAYLTTGTPTAYQIFTEVTDGTIEVGFEQTEAINNWSGIDNVKLTYFGFNSTMADLNEAKYGSYKARIAELKEQILDIVDIPTAAYENNEAEVNSTADEFETEDEYKNAISNLEALLNKAQAYADAQAAISKANIILSLTNVYTEDAFNAFNEQTGSWISAMEDATLTLDEAKAVNGQIFGTGWRAENLIDDVLMSAWESQNYDGYYYINTWSTEGNTDGSDFTVPFFEYWTNDDASLADKTLTATVNGLEPGDYDVKALVRVRIKNGETEEPRGITLRANAGNPVEVTSGEQVEGTPFYLARFTATGTVEEDGVLAIQFEVTDNNISWLSFKDVYYSKVEVLPEDIVLDFSTNTPITDPGICTYEKDKGDNSTTLAQMTEVEGWTIGVTNGDARAAGIYAYGSEKWLGGQGFNVPATNPEGEAEGNALGIEAVWTADAQYLYPITLAPGNYTVTFSIYNAPGADGNGGTTAPAKSLFGFIDSEGEEYLADAKSYPVGEWTEEVVSFAIEEETEGNVSVGLVSQNVGNAASMHLFIDKVTITPVSEKDAAIMELDAAIAEANDQIEASRPNIGEELFFVSQEAIDALQAAVDAADQVRQNEEATADELLTAADDLEEAMQTFNEEGLILPEPNKQYVFQQKASSLYLEPYITYAEETGEMTATGVRLSEEPVALQFEEAEDGYFLYVDGQYVGVAGTNNWTMSGLEEKKEALTFNPVIETFTVGEGDEATEMEMTYYTIRTSKGLIGTDNTEAGSSCYANKGQNDNSLWSIAEIDDKEDDTEEIFNLYIDRYVGMGYTAQSEAIDEPDMQEAFDFLGIGGLDEATLVGVNVSDDTFVENAMDDYDGWRDWNGDFKTWPDINTSGEKAVCVKWYDGILEICDFPNANAPVAGDEFVAKWALQANGKTVIFIANISFVEQPVVTYPIVATITVNHEEEEATAYSEKTATFDVAAVCTALGIEDITAAEQYIVNVTDGTFVPNTTDGWRDANGDAKSWQQMSDSDEEGGVCVKISDPASGIIDYIGCFDDTHKAGETYTAKWAFVYDDKAVVVDVVITFAEAAVPDAISGIISAKAPADIYNVNGVMVRKAATGVEGLTKGIYIINGKKVFVK